MSTSYPNPLCEFCGGTGQTFRDCWSQSQELHYTRDERCECTSQDPLEWDLLSGGGTLYLVHAQSHCYNQAHEDPPPEAIEEVRANSKAEAIEAVRTQYDLAYGEPFTFWAEEPIK